MSPFFILSLELNVRDTILFTIRGANKLTEESARRQPSMQPKFATANVPFAEIPGQTRLFLDHLSRRDGLAEFYPEIARTPHELAATVPSVLSEYSVDRGKVCEALLDINKACGASDVTFRNIEKLRQPNTVAVLTGQQAGLFGGPLYTIYKAMSAIKMAAELEKIGVSAVPLFWAATEDHDFDEVSSVSNINRADQLESTSYIPSDRKADFPVGSIEVDDGINEVIENVFDALSHTEYSDELRASLADAWSVGRGFGEAFLRQLAKIFAKYGLVFVDPRNLELKRLSSPILQDAIRSSDKIADSLTARSIELTERGYHSQVLVESDHVTYFLINDAGERSAVRKVGESTYRSKIDKREYSLDNLVEIARTQPERISPGVMLRPVVQDHLFPTICYFGGGAEIAYFAQNSVVYKHLGRRSTPIIHRQSLTLVESRHHRTVDKYGLDLTAMLVGRDVVLPRLVEKYLSPETAKLIADVEERINAELSRLDSAVIDIDVTLAANLAKRRQKMIYHIGAIRKKAFAAALRNSGDAERRLNAAFESLLPGGHLQERSINLLTFVNRYGISLIDSIYDSIDIEQKDHVVVYL